MTKEEMIKKIVEFEFMMQEYHRYNTRYTSGGLSFFSAIMHDFGARKEKKVYKQLLEDVKLIYHECSFDEYQLLRKRIITAYEP